MPLFHFTDSRNLPSIRKHGLLSWKQLLHRGIQHWAASSEDSRRYDARSQLEDYVRLCMSPNHPMAFRALYEGRIKDFVWLEISDAVIAWKSTLFSSDNAVANRTIINSDPRTALESDSPQAEVLIQKRLDPRWISFPTASDKTAPSNNRDDFDFPF